MAEAFAAVGLTPQDVEKPVGELSGGQRRRVALLRALLAPADVVVLDEPFKGLDEAARGRRPPHMCGVCGRTLLCITHGGGRRGAAGRAGVPAAGGGGTAEGRAGRSRDNGFGPFLTYGQLGFLNLSERCGTRRQARK